MLNKVFGKKILIVEDDRELLDSLCDYFGASNTIYPATTLADADEILSSVKLDGIILDLLLPDGDGMELLKNSRLMPPTLILTTTASENTQLEALCSGAADYIVKPCSPRLLETRLSLRLLPPECSEVSLSGLTVNSSTRTVKYHGKSLNITGSEFNILWFLMCRAGNFFDADTIYENIWEAPSLHQASIRYHISNLRRKLFDMTEKNLIITEFGKGYKFAKESDAE